MEDITASVKKLRMKYREVFQSFAEEFGKKIETLKSDEVPDFIQKTLREILEGRLEVLAQRRLFKCACCGACCKLACSEFSPEQLREKAEKGDVFARQFTSVFVPYETKDEARVIYPEYIDMLEKSTDGKTYFYHCPKVTEDNKCSDYENRPQICRDFPDNPIALLPKTCGYVKWKEGAVEKMLKLHAMLEIVEYYKGHLNAGTNRA